MSSNLCERCGAFGDLPHGWVEGDCILPHKEHSRRLLDGGLICQACADRWIEWLNEITELHGTLAAVLYVGDVVDDTAEHTHSKRSGSPSPIRLNAWALHRNEINDHITDRDGTDRPAYLGANLPDIAAVLTGWAHTVYEEHHQGEATIARTVYAAAAWLRANVTLAAASPHVDDIDAELRWVRRALRAAHGVTDAEPLFSCLSVGCRGHVWPMSAGSPACDHCGRRYGTLDMVRARGDGLPERRRLTSVKTGTGRA